MNAELERLRAENAALRKELQRHERRIRQVERLARTTHELERQSKASMLRTHAKLVESNQSLEAARRDAESASQAKGRFLAAMSHEIRTPMNGVIGFIELLRGTALDADQARLVGTLGASADSLMALLNDVLDFAKLQAERVQIEQRPFDLHALLQAVHDVESLRARSKGIVLHLELGPSLPRYVSGDEHRLRQVLNNLVNNAIKFTSEGSVSLRAGALETDEHVRFEVVDTGIGIPASRQQAIFEAFTQADESVSRRFGGTGLGLSISRQLVRAMGGDLAVESAVGAGSTFRFDLALPSVEASRVPTRAASHIAHPPVRARALVVDDHGVNRLLAQKLMERIGCEAVTVDSGLAALERLHEGDFSVVLMDCQMPEMDGFEATRRIRALPMPYCDVAIVALTGQAMPGDRERCLDAGMDEYLTKPIRIDELRRVIGALTSPGARST